MLTSKIGGEHFFTNTDLPNLMTLNRRFVSFLLFSQGKAAVVIQEVQNCHAADKEITDKAENIGNISEEEETDNGRENDL